MGHGPRRELRRFARPRRRGTPPSGPFTGRDIERVVRASGWLLEEPATSEQFAVYTHPLERDCKVPINPDWPRIVFGDPIFKCLSRDLRIPPDELARRLAREHA